MLDPSYATNTVGRSAYYDNLIYKCLYFDLSSTIIIRFTIKLLTFHQRFSSDINLSKF